MYNTYEGLLHIPLTFILLSEQLQQLGSSKPPVQLEHSPVSRWKPTQFFSQNAASNINFNGMNSGSINIPLQ